MRKITCRECGALVEMRMSAISARAAAPVLVENRAPPETNEFPDRYQREDIEKSYDVDRIAKDGVQTLISERLEVPQFLNQISTPVSSICPRRRKAACANALGRPTKRWSNGSTPGSFADSGTEPAGPCHGPPLGSGSQPREG